MLDNTDPLIELQNIEYCILERIGQSRKLGTLTQGKTSLANQFKMDPKSIFHYEKQMTKYGLLKKQFFCIRSQDTEINKMGMLIHLRRFFSRVKQKQELVIEQMVDILKTQPHYRMPTVLMKDKLENFQPINRIAKSKIFRKCIKLVSVSILLYFKAYIQINYMFFY